MSVDPVLIERFNAKWVTDEATGCHIWTGAKLPKGYGFIKLPGERRQVYAHRLAYLIHYGDIPPRMQVCHRCDNPSCVNPEHLFLGSSADNHQDMKAKGRHLYGERNKQTKLTEEQVAEIRELIASGMRHADIAVRYGVHKSAISKIATGTRWQHSTRGPRVPPKPRTKLTDREVLAVRAMWEVGLTQREIAEKFGITPGQVSKIVRFERWRHLKPENPTRNEAHAPLLYRHGN